MAESGDHGRWTRAGRRGRERHKARFITPPTKLQTFFFGVRITRIRIDPKHDIDVIPGHFHPLDQGADEVAFASSSRPPLSRRGPCVAKSSRRPIISCNSVCRAAASTSCCRCSSRLGDALAQAENPGLKFLLVNEALRITINEPREPLAQLAELGFDRGQRRGLCVGDSGCKRRRYSSASRSGWASNVETSRHTATSSRSVRTWVF